MGDKKIESGSQNSLVSEVMEFLFSFACTKLIAYRIGTNKRRLKENGRLGVVFYMEA